MWLTLRWAEGTGAVGDRIQLDPPASLPQVPVPRHSVGVVIGRSGEMIKKIQNDAGVRIQFKQGQGLSQKDELGGGGLCPPALSSRSFRGRCR